MYAYLFLLQTISFLFKISSPEIKWLGSFSKPREENLCNTDSNLKWKLRSFHDQASPDITSKCGNELHMIQKHAVVNYIKSVNNHLCSLFSVSLGFFVWLGFFSADLDISASNKICIQSFVKSCLRREVLKRWKGVTNADCMWETILHSLFSYSPWKIPTQITNS